jgi:hypothetical protein
MGEPVQQHLMPLKKYEELDRDENIVLSNRNNAPTLSVLVIIRIVLAPESTAIIVFPS